MSGGSYNYLCHKDFENIFDSISDIEDMRDALVKKGYLAAAEETEQVLVTMQSARIQIQTRLDRLHDIWRAIEWWESCDIGDESLEEANKEYEQQL